MASSPIAELPVIITGDFSELSDSINQATSAAQDGADKIAAAFNIPDAFGQLDQQAQDAASAFQELAPAADTVSASFNETTTASDDVYAALANTALSGQDVIDALNGVGASGASAATGLKETGEAATESLISVESLKNAFLEFAGISLTLAALKEAITETVTAFGNEQAAAIAMTAALGGNAAAANEMIEQAKQLANFLGQSNEAMITAAQRMVNFGVSAGDVSNALIAVGTAAEGSNQSFETVGAQFDRMAAGGTIMARSISAAGLTMDDIGAAMGRAGEPTKDIIEAFKGLGDTATRMDVLTSAVLTHLPTLAEDASTSVNNAWQQLKNTTENAFEAIGKSVSGFTPLVDVFKGGVDLIASAVLGLIGAAKELYDAWTLVFTGLGDGIATLAVAFKDAATGDLQRAWEDIKAGAEKTHDDVAAAWGKMVTDAQTTGGQIRGIWQESFGGAATSVAESVKQIEESLDSAKNANGTLLASLDRLAAGYQAQKTTLADYATETQQVIQYAQQHGLVTADLATKITQLTQGYASHVITIQQYAKGLQDLLPIQAAHIDKIVAAVTGTALLKQQVDALFDSYDRGKISAGDLNTKLQSVADTSKGVSQQFDDLIKKDVETHLEAIAKGAANVVTGFANVYQKLLDANAANDQFDLGVQQNTDDLNSLATGFDDVNTRNSTYINSLNNSVNLSGQLSDAFQGLHVKSDQQVQDLLTQAGRWYDTITAMHQYGLVSDQAFGEASDAWTALVAKLANSGTVATNVTNDFKTLGIQSSAELDRLADKAATAYNNILNSSKSTTTDIQNAWVAMIDAQIAAGDKLSIQTQIQYVAMIDKIKAQNDNWITDIQRIQNAISNDLSKALGDVIFQTGNITDAFKKMGQDVVDIILNHLIKEGIDVLMSKLDDVIGKLAGVLGGGGGSGGGVLGTAVGAGGSAAGAAGEVAGGAGSAAGGIGSLLGGSLSGWIGVGISAISGIVQGIQGARMNDLLAEIEKSTRYSMITEGGTGGTNSIVANTLVTAQKTASILDVMWQFWPDWWNFLNDMDSIMKLEASGGGTQQIVDGLNQVVDAINAMTDALLGGDIAARLGMQSDIMADIRTELEPVAGYLDGLTALATAALAQLQVIAGGALGGPAEALAVALQQAASAAQAQAQAANDALNALQQQSDAAKQQAADAQTAADAAAQNATQMQSAAEAAQQQAETAQQQAAQLQSNAAILRANADAAATLAAQNPGNLLDKLNAGLLGGEATKAEQQASWAADNAAALTDAAQAALTAANDAQNQATQAQQTAQDAATQATTLMGQLTAAITAAGQAQAAATAAQAAANDAANRAAAAVGMPVTSGGSGGVSGSAMSSLAEYISAQFSALYSYLNTALAPIYQLLHASASTGILTPPAAIPVPAFSGAAGSSAGSAGTVDTSGITGSLSLLQTGFSALAKALADGFAGVLKAFTDLDSFITGSFVGDIRLLNTGILALDMSFQSFTVDVAKLNATLMPATGTSSTHLTIHNNFNAPVVGGQAGMNELTQTIGDNMVNRLRQGGLKVDY